MGFAIHKVMTKMGLNPAEDLRDSTVDIMVKVHAADIMRAKRKDPAACVLARAACKALPDIVEAWFYKTSAFVHQVTPSGKSVIVRFINGTAARKQIEAFDKNGTFVPGEFLLMAPKGQYALTAGQARSRARPGRHMPGSGKIRRRVKAKAKRDLVRFHHGTL